MKTRKITTSLLDKEEVFKVLALAEASGLPVLLIGPPGVGKTNCMVDYAKSELKSSEDMNKLFIIETDEQTKPSSIKGQIDIKALAVDKEWRKIRPIATAQYIMINEIDKANSGCRNAMLSIMNEKRIFDGDEVVKLRYDMFVASCNEIPGDELGSPFWDRFAIRYTVGRTSVDNITKFIVTGGEQQEISINIPNKADLDAIKLNPEKMGIFIHEASSHLTDRSLTRLGTLVKSAMVVYGEGEVEAILKIASLVAPSIVKSLSQKLEDKDVVKLKGFLDDLSRTLDEGIARKLLDNIEYTLLTINGKRGLAKEEKIKYMKLAKETIMNSNSIVQKVHAMMQEQEDNSPEPVTE